MSDDPLEGALREELEARNAAAARAQAEAEAAKAGHEEDQRRYAEIEEQVRAQVSTLVRSFVARATAIQLSYTSHEDLTTRHRVAGVIPYQRHSVRSGWRLDVGWYSWMTAGDHDVYDRPTERRSPYGLVAFPDGSFDFFNGHLATADYVENLKKAMVKALADASGAEALEPPPRPRTKNRRR